MYYLDYVFVNVCIFFDQMILLKVTKCYTVAPIETLHTKYARLNYR